MAPLLKRVSDESAANNLFSKTTEASNGFLHVHTFAEPMVTERKKKKEKKRKKNSGKIIHTDEQPNENCKQGTNKKRPIFLFFFWCCVIGRHGQCLMCVSSIGCCDGWLLAGLFAESVSYAESFCHGSLFSWRFWVVGLWLFESSVSLSLGWLVGSVTVTELFTKMFWVSRYRGSPR